MRKLLALLLLVCVGFSYSITAFNDSSTSKLFNFSGAGSNASFWVNLPKNATIVSASFSLAGVPAANWTNATSPASSEITDIYMFNDSLGYATGPNAGFLRWNGSSWSALSSFGAYKFYFDAWNAGYAVNRTYDIYRWNGIAWTQTGTSDDSGNEFWDIDAGYAVGRSTASGGMLVYYNVTGTPAKSINGSGSALYGVDRRRDGGVYAVGVGGYFARCVPSCSSALSSTSNDLYAFESGIAVGQNGQIVSVDSDAMANVTSPLPETSDFNLYNTDGRYAVGIGGIIVSAGGSNVTQLATTADLSAVSSTGLTFGFAAGEGGEIIRYYGLPNGVKMGVNGPTGAWNQTGVDLVSQSASLTSAVQSYVSACSTATCSVPLNISTAFAGAINITSLNITYGTKIIGVPPGITFNDSDGDDLMAEASVSDKFAYVFNGSSLIGSMLINFSVQPNFSGWSFEEAWPCGVNSTDNRSYTIMPSLDNATNPMNLSQKTMYVEYSNASATKVCVIDNASVNSTQLMAITNESQCTDSGGEVRTPNTTTFEDINRMGGKIALCAFIVTGTANSGAVQIIGNPGTNSPVVTDSPVLPSSGNQYTYFAFSATVTDADNDVMDSVVVNIGGANYAASETDPADVTTSDGKDYSCTVLLSGATNYSYYFTATDNTTRSGSSSTSYLYVSYSSEGGVTVSPAPGFTLALAVITFAFAAVLMIGRRR